MKSLIRCTFCLLIALLVVTACNMGVGALPEKLSGEEAEGDEETAKEPVTGARVAVPMVSTRLLEALDATYDPHLSGQLSASAFLFGTAMDVTVLKDSAPLYTLNLTAGDFEATMGGDGPPMLEAYIELEAGSGYDLDVLIYNEKVGPDPVIQGTTTSSFSVSAGASTPVLIYGIPYAPDPLDTGTSSYSDVSIAQVPYEFSGEDVVVTGIGGEAWYVFNYTANVDEYARIVMDPAGDADAVMLTYDETGAGDNEWPAMSWGFFPTEFGGQGGTRAAFIGELEPSVEFTGYLGALLANRDGLEANESFDIYLDVIPRPQPDPAYENALPASVEPGPDDFYPLAADEEVTQIVFWDESGDSEEPIVHYFALSDVDWDGGLMDTIPVTIEVTFDALHSEHIFGGDPEEGGIQLALMVGDQGSMDPPDMYTAIMDSDFLVTPNVDRTTTLSFEAEVDVSGATVDTLGVIAVSSYWEGNQFTLSWSAPSEVYLTIQ